MTDRSIRDARRRYSESTPALIKTLIGERSILIWRAGPRSEPDEGSERLDEIVEFAGIGKFGNLPMGQFVRHGGATPVIGTRPVPPTAGSGSRPR